MTDYSALIAELSRVGLQSVNRGLALASGGNLSARHPGSGEFIVTRAGVHLDRLGAADFVVAPVAGDRGADAGPRPSSEWKLHQRIYRVRPDVNAIVHVHPQHAVLLHALGKEIRLITLDHAYYVRSVGAVPYFPNGSDELADHAAEQAREHECMVLAHHGCSTLGPDIEMAFRRALNLEEAAVTTYRALTLGNETLTFPDEAFASLHHA